MLKIYGGDYPTPDGTGVRDYIHVVDLAIGHLKALDKLATGPGVFTYNLGTGRGYSVLEVLAAFERRLRQAAALPDRRPAAWRQRRQTTPRRRGPTRSLRWATEHDIDAMCVDAWRWQSCPQGYV